MGLLQIKVSIMEEPSSKTPFSTNLTAFINSGAMGNFMHPCIVNKLQIPKHPCTQTLELQMVTGNKFFEVKHQVTAILTTAHGHEEKLVLDVAPIRKHDLILGLPWCQYHGIQFDWANQDIIQWSPECEG